MNDMTCLQYCINGMNEQIFEFANSKDGKALVKVYKKWFFIREEQIKELLIAYTSYYMVQAGIELNGMPKTEKSVIEFMGSKAFDKLQKDLIKTIRNNYPMLISLLTPDQRNRLDTLFS